jgi:hypothetical protein
VVAGARAEEVRGADGVKGAAAPGRVTIHG